MNILVLNGSPRPNGTTAAMVDAFAEGAKEAGHKLDVISVLKLEDMGIYTLHEKQNHKEELLEALRQLGKLLE